MDGLDILFTNFLMSKKITVVEECDATKASCLFNCREQKIFHSEK
jgi:hypothetical protein